jgi:hypothetical protein
MMVEQITPYQVGLLQHTLGLSERRRESHRNFFIAGEGHHDQAGLTALVAAGLMKQARAPEMFGGGDLFTATDSGKEIAIAALPEPVKPTRYQEYLNADGCGGDTFGEFLLGGRLPKVETRCGLYYPSTHPNRHLSRSTHYRMYRLQYFQDDFGFDSYREVEGDWCPTMKEAKASYKAALKAKREARQ